MPVVRSIRIHLPDRPGALSSISTALAVHDVNIERLRVVSHEGPYVIDDLDLSAETPAAIDRAVAGFYPDVRVESFDSTLGDPVTGVASGMKAIALASTRQGATQAMVAHALTFIRADAGTVLDVSGGGFGYIAGAPLAAMAPAQESALRTVAETGVPAALTMAEGGWALPFTGIDAAAAAASRVDASTMLVVARRARIGFASGELERLAAFADAAGAVLALK